MDIATRPSPLAPPGEGHRRQDLLAAVSIEISPSDELAGERLRDLFPTGMTVFVNHPASVTHHDIVAACARLRRAGFNPVPHIAARRLASFTQVSDFLRRAAGEAEVTGALLIGGDPDRPTGPFGDSLALLASGVFERHGLRWIAFAGYPEGHPNIGDTVLEGALRGKIALAQGSGLDVCLVTQFGFNAAPIQRWIATLRAEGIDCPVRVGIAGPASVTTLAKFAVRCGIGASLRALARGHAAFARILVEATPDALIDALVAGEDAGPPIDGLHIFTFGGMRRTAAWLQSCR
ncbi:MAG TPA: hypothetical protein VGS13_09315 [Stellaceae bacterium]|nr:hypothetical protein [Stellaceae bacterium]